MNGLKAMGRFEINNICSFAGAVVSILLALPSIHELRNGMKAMGRIQNICSFAGTVGSILLAAVGTAVWH